MALPVLQTIFERAVRREPDCWLLSCAACRWLVSDRKDGANVNGWHWEERNMMGWSRDKLTELLVGLVADIRPEEGAAELTELKDLKGEVSLWAGCSRQGWFVLHCT